MHGRGEQVYRRNPMEIGQIRLNTKDGKKGARFIKRERNEA
jgi:hypothetical protein